MLILCRATGEKKDRTRQLSAVGSARDVGGDLTYQDIFVLPSWKNILSLGIPNSPVSSGGNVAVMSPCTSMCSPPPGFFLTEDDVANFLDIAFDTALSFTS